MWFLGLNKKISIFGDGTQTRTLNYVDDTIDGFFTLIDNNVTDPINVGGEDEMSVIDIAKRVVSVLGGEENFEHVGRPEDEPMHRKPNIDKLKKLGYKSKVSLDDGLKRTCEVMREEGFIK